MKYNDTNDSGKQDADDKPSSVNKTASESEKPYESLDKEQVAKQPPRESKDEGEGDDHMIPEEYQQKAHALISKAPKHHLDHLRSRISAREDELREEERAKREKNKPKGDFSMDSAPSSLREMY